MFLILGLLDLLLDLLGPLGSLALRGRVLVLPLLHRIEGLFYVLLQVIRVEQVVLSVINL